MFLGNRKKRDETKMTKLFEAWKPISQFCEKKQFLKLGLYVSVMLINDKYPVNLCPVNLLSFRLHGYNMFIESQKKVGGRLKKICKL